MQFNNRRDEAHSLSQRSSTAVHASSPDTSGHEEGSLRQRRAVPLDRVSAEVLARVGNSCCYRHSYHTRPQIGSKETEMRKVIVRATPWEYSPGHR